MSSSIDFLSAQPSTSYSRPREEIPLEVIANSPEEDKKILTKELNLSKIRDLLSDLNLGDISRTPAELTAISELLLANEEAEAISQIDKLQEAKINIPIGSSRETLLSIAVAADHLPIAQLLLRKGACLSCRNLRDQTALHLAADQGNVSMISFLLDNGAYIDYIDKDHLTPLYFSVKQGHVEAVKLFIERKAMIHCVNRHCETPLHWAAFVGHTVIVELLINALKEQSLLEVNCKSNSGQTPLHLIAYCPDIQRTYAIAKRLLQEGADSNLGTNYGFTPLHWALRCCSDMNILKPYAFSDYSFTLKPYDWKNLEELLDLFLHYGADINRANESGSTSLHHAVKIRAHPKLLYLLIQKGADLSLKNKEGKTPFDFATIFYPEIAPLLRIKEKKKCIII